MRLLKNFIILIFLSAFAFQISAQESPKIVWKNLQEKYESFYEIKPILVNNSNQTIYFDCLTSDYGTFSNYGYDLNFKMLWNNIGDNWDWNVFFCGTMSNKELSSLEKQKRRREKLVKQGKYIPSGCKLEPNQEFEIKFSKKLWDGITGESGDPYTKYIYKSGKYKFTLQYEWANAQNPAISESSIFLVTLKN